MTTPKLNSVDSSFIDDFLNSIETVEDPNNNLDDPKELDVDDTEKTEDVIKSDNTVLTLNNESFNFSDLVEDDGSVVNLNKNKNVNKTTTSTTSIDNLNQLVEDGVLFGFDDDEFKIKTVDDVKELIEANKEQWQNEARAEVRAEAIEEYFSDLPEDFTIALEYVKNGGRDMKTLFKTLSAGQEITSLDPQKNPRDVVRTYLEHTQFGTDEEIQDQLDEWEDSELISKKANLFKPKLDKLVEDNNQEMILRQAEIAKRQEALAEQYYKGVDTILKEKTINGFQLTKDEIRDVKKGLLESNYTSTRTGKPLNQLSKFLEEITWDKPNYALLAELALWAKDPEEFKNKLRKQGKEENVADIAKTLKTGSQIKDNTFINEPNKQTGKVMLPRKSNLLKRK